MEGNNYQKNLIALLKIFKNRPYHLAKYLHEHDAFTDGFISKLKNSAKLSNFSDENYINDYFSNISQMEDFYHSLLDEINEKTIKKDKAKFTIELNTKLNKLIDEEKYEEAAALRDFMIKNGIKKTN
jgi:hypothetical protein